MENKKSFNILDIIKLSLKGIILGSAIGSLVVLMLKTTGRNNLIHSFVMYLSLNYITLDRSLEGRCNDAEILILAKKERLILEIIKFVFAAMTFVLYKNVIITL